MRNKKASPISKVIAMTRFYDLNLSVNTNTTIQTYHYIEIFAHPKKIHDFRLRNAALIEIEASLGSS